MVVNVLVCFFGRNAMCKKLGEIYKVWPLQCSQMFQYQILKFRVPCHCVQLPRFTFLCWVSIKVLANLCVVDSCLIGSPNTHHQLLKDFCLFLFFCTFVVYLTHLCVKFTPHQKVATKGWEFLNPNFHSWSNTKVIHLFNKGWIYSKHNSSQPSVCS